MNKIGITLYNIVLALWVGGMAIFTFLITPIVFKAFPRDMASAIVDKLFPLYFPYILILSVLTLAFFLLSRLLGDRRSLIALALIMIAIGINTFITFKLFPAIRE